jgi:hypothetical protein
MLRKIIMNNTLLTTIVIFFVLFSIIYYLKPKMIFDSNGLPMEFGIGYDKKTITPIWLVIMIIAIISYIITLYYTNIHHNIF